MKIASKNNKIITHVKSLHKKKYRDKNNQFFIEGHIVIKNALENESDFEFVIINEDKQNHEINDLIPTFELKGIKTYFVSDSLFNQMSDTKTPQGILAVINKSENNVQNVVENSEFLILLENVQDSGNMGTIIRTADAAGVSGIIISKGSVDIYNPKVLRSTMGSVFNIPIASVQDLTDIINNLKRNNFNILAAHPYGNISCYEVDMSLKTAIVIGNEANGVSKEVLNECTQIKIPMLGKAESLNASVAASILIYERVRQKLNN